MEPSEFKLVLVGDESQFDPKPSQSLMETFDKLEWESAPCDPEQNPEPHLKIRLKGDIPLMAPRSTSQNSIAYDIKGSDKFTQLYQVGSYGSCLSALRSRMICEMEGDFSSKGAPRMCVVKSFQSGSHVNQQVPDTFVNSPLPIESFLHIHTWQTKCSTSGQKYALEFDTKYAGVTGIVVNNSTLLQHRWHSSVDWPDWSADYVPDETLNSTLHAMGLDYNRLPATRDPWCQHAYVTDQIEASVSHHEARWLCSLATDHSSWPSLRASHREHP